MGHRESLREVESFPIIFKATLFYFGHFSLLNKSNKSEFGSSSWPDVVASSVNERRRERSLGVLEFSGRMKLPECPQWPSSNSPASSFSFPQRRWGWGGKVAGGRDRAI
jgi:hypothetical protein